MAMATIAADKIGSRVSASALASSQAAARPRGFARVGAAIAGLGAAVLGAAKLDEERRPLLRVDGHVSDAGRA